MFIRKTLPFVFFTVLALGFFITLPLYAEDGVQVLCDRETFDGYTTTPFKLKSDETGNGTIQKIIRNCTFQNSNVPAITLQNASNVLIENNTFLNIRTHKPGVGVHAINAACGTKCSNIVVRGNTFEQIGADGIQIGDSGRNVTEFTIEGNTFIGVKDIGENAIDIKGADGAVYIRNNLIKGFRPCLSPSKGGSQDCSGSPGEGVVLHEGAAAGAPGNVTVEGNIFQDNIFGLSVSRTLPNIIVKNNTFDSNVKIGLLVSNATDILAETNNFISNPIHIFVKNTQNCTLIGNTFQNGKNLVLNQSKCTQPDKAVKPIKKHETRHKKNKR